MIRKFNILSKKTVKPEQGSGKGAIVLSLDSSRGLEFLVELVKKIRPLRASDKEQAELQFGALLYTLQQDRSLLFSLRRSLLTQFMHTDIVPALTESGMVSSRGFVQELGRKLQHKILPPLQERNDFRFVLNRVFSHKTDYRWVEAIDPGLWKSFFELLGIQINLTETKLIQQLQRSIQILSYRLANAGLEREVSSRLGSSAHFPFLEQNRLVNLYVERSGSGYMMAEEKKALVSNIGEALSSCRQSLQWMKDQRLTEGTSLAQTFLIVRMEQYIERMYIILDVLDGDQQFNTERFISYFTRVVRFENRRNSMREFLQENLSMLAYQIAEHKGRKGERYISTGRRDFFTQFRSSMRGGFIISFIAIFKNLLMKLPLAPFWQGLVFGANYSMGFVLMDQAGGTLATKQPAYTASAVAGSLDTRKTGGRPDLRNLAITVARVSRSQIMSFAGNLIVVFPLSYLLAMAWDWMTGSKIAEGAAAMNLLMDQHPWKSLALLYAAFTGVFLFLSGIIAGFVENYMVYGKVPERMNDHPIFSFTMSKKRLYKMVEFVRMNAGALAGSISLGFFLGISGPLGKVMGLPFDIRHITISAGNVAIGFYGLDHAVPITLALTIFLSVLTIGFINFLVSFSLAFYVAVRSRGIRLKDYPEFLGMLFRYFREHPADFFFPPRKPRVADDL